MQLINLFTEFLMTYSLVPIQISSVLCANASLQHELWCKVLSDRVRLHRCSQHSLHCPPSLPLCLWSHLRRHRNPQQTSGSSSKGASSELWIPKQLSGSTGRQSELSRADWLCHVWQQELKVSLLMTVTFATFIFINSNVDFLPCHLNAKHLAANPEIGAKN